VFAVEREQLRPDGDVVRGQRELKPRGVRLERVKRQESRAGRVECLDAVLDLGVLAMQRLERGDVVVGLVGGEAVKAMPVQVGDGELRAGVRALRAGRSAGCRRASRAG
jgi:hypothetical protein